MTMTDADKQLWDAWMAPHNSCLWSVEAAYLRALAKRDMAHWRKHNEQNERIVTNNDVRQIDWADYYQKRKDKRKVANHASTNI